MKKQIGGTSRGGLCVFMASVTVLAIIAVVVALLMFPGAALPADGIRATARTGHEVRQSQVVAYCPAQMALADSEKYGDVQFQASEGNITSSALYSSFGSVYKARVGSLTDVDGVNGVGRELEGNGSYEGPSVKVLSDRGNAKSSILVSKLLNSKEGTGSVAAVGSWATSGDLKGVSAASCVSPSLESFFLLPATAAGATHQLIVANPSEKPTTLHLDVWGTKSGRPLALHTGNTLTVAAHHEANVDLSAGAPGQDGLFVKVTSNEVPVAAVVRCVLLDGLSSKGSDFALPLGEPGTSQVLAGVGQGDEVNVAVRSDRAADAEIFWTRHDGEESVRKVHLEPGRVSVTDLGRAGQDVYGVSVRSDAPVQAQAQVGDSGSDGSADFALIPAARQAGRSAVAVPGGMNGVLSFINASNSAVEATVHGYDVKGGSVGSQQISINAHGAQVVPMSDISDSAVLFELESGGNLAWGVRVGQQDVSSANLAAVAYLSATGLEPSNAQIFSEPTRMTVR
ncbi:DUF5719 family protein [Bifidobacterium bombi]|nr:DUF5719 family protein [Bifidobacterium bombi]